jgi:hypothetical protein
MLRRTTVLLSAVLVASGALVGLAGSTAQAASGIDARSNIVAVGSPNSSGHRPVYVYAKCVGSKTCSGRAAILGQPRYFNWPYSIKGNSAGYIKLYWLGDDGNPVPTGLGAAPGQQGTTFTRTLRVYPSGAKARDKTITLERRQASRKLRGSVAGPGLGSRVTDVEVTSWRVSGLVSRRLKTVPVGADGTYDFGNVSLGTNNASSYGYRLSISATVDGTNREWFWRGVSGKTYGGGKRVSESHAASVGKYGDFIADFRFGRIHGTLSGAGSTGTDVRVIAPPAVRPTRSADRRGLDADYCGNEFGADTTSSGGAYDITFLPVSQNGDKRYLIAHEGSNRAGVITEGGRQYASCNAATKYTYSTSDDDLISYGTGGLDATISANLDSGKHALAFDTDPTYTSKLAAHDTWTTVREYVPGTKILDRPIITAGHASTAGYKKFEGLRNGKYWVEVGRRTGCSAWYPSIYKDNYLYHKGGERGNERWKTVNGTYPEYQTSYRYGYVARKPPSGKKGWMYRDACVAQGAGDYKLVTVRDGDATSNSSTLRKGATISGKVTRIGGKSNKEMLVSAYSTQGTLVMRSAYTSSSGTFVIRGLASGNYRILVNGDSWRGIGRTHKGTQTKRVTAGKSYSVGTLNFRS